MSKGPSPRSARASRTARGRMAVRQPLRRAGRRDRAGHDEIVCRLCGGTFRAISLFHLRWKHGCDGPTPIQDYKRRFGLRVACSRETCRLVRAASIGAAVRRGARWTRPRVLAVLKQRARDAEPLAPALVATELYGAARRLFGSWRGALAEAGLDPADHLIAGRWSRERVVDAIRALRREGGSLTSKRVQESARSLHMAAERHLGSWGRALRAAGLDPARHREPRRWSLERARAWIEDRLARGLPITAGHVPLGLVGCVAREARTGWGAFVESTGRDYPGPIRHGWTRARVVQRIRDRRRRRLPLNHKALVAGDRRLLHQARRRFGTWDRALRAAGIEPAGVRLTRRWTWPSLVAAIRARHAAGEPLSRRTVWAQDEQLVRAARRLGWVWAGALRAAGLNPALARAPARR